MQGKLTLFLIRFFSWLPLWLSHAIGAGIGRCLYLIPSSLRDITVINLKLCFPEWGDQQRRRITYKSLIETGKSATEIGALWHWKPSRIAKLVQGVSGEEIVQAAQQKGRGIIFLTPHLGATKGVKALCHALADKQNIGILPDQDPGNNGGIFAPFFGVTANTMALVSRLAKKTGAPVIYIYAERLPKGRGYRIYFHDASDAVYDSDTIQSATAINQGIEYCVREHPEQYQWSYKRFKTRPAGETDFY